MNKKAIILVLLGMFLLVGCQKSKERELEEIRDRMYPIDKSGVYVK